MSRRLSAEFYKQQLEGMTEARDRFCAAVNDIARAIGMTGKDHYAPEAVLRRAEKQNAYRQIAEKYIGLARVYLKEHRPERAFIALEDCCNEMDALEGDKPKGGRSRGA